MMIPTDQTTFRDNATGSRGNCLSAAIASLLHLPIDDVPLFIENDWRRKLNKFLRPYGVAFLALNDIDPVALKVLHGIEGLNHTLSGMSPRGIRHSCVGLDGKLVFDPHPDRSGFDEKFRHDIYPGVFVILEPWKYITTNTETKEDNMGDNTPGQRKLSEEEVKLVNAVREAGANLKELVGRLNAHSETDKRWVAIGVTDLQKGIASLTRAVERPDFF